MVIAVADFFDGFPKQKLLLRPAHHFPQSATLRSLAMILRSVFDLANLLLAFGPVFDSLISKLDI
jgi:hypothetical protein